MSLTKVEAVHDVYLYETSGGAVTHYLPDAEKVRGYVVYVKKTNSGGGNITIEPKSGQTIDGGSSVTVNTAHASHCLLSDGANWYTLATK